FAMVPLAVTVSAVIEAAVETSIEPEPVALSKSLQPLASIEAEPRRSMPTPLALSSDRIQFPPEPEVIATARAVTVGAVLRKGAEIASVCGCATITSTAVAFEVWLPDFGG